MSDIDAKEDLKNDANVVGLSDHVEDIQFKNAEELTELSGIEATAASKAAWLICITVSLGGLLFGT